MDLVFPAEHGLLTAEGLPVVESDTQLAHTRPEPFSIYAGLPCWLADGMSVGIASHKPTCGPESLPFVRHSTAIQSIGPRPQEPIPRLKTDFVDRGLGCYRQSEVA